MMAWRAGPEYIFLLPMVYKVIGLMSGSSLDGLDIAYVHLQVNAGKWEFSLVATTTYPYTDEWRKKLAEAPRLSAMEYQLLHTDYGHYLGEQVNRFIEEHRLHYQVQLIASHGHTSFHLPARKMTAQLGDGAALAAETSINVVSDLRAMDLALGGQGAPIVPIGEKLLLPGYGFFLNLGGIANLSSHVAGTFVAFDVCPSGRVLDSLAGLAGKKYDEGGTLTSSGKTDEGLLQRLNALAYYGMPYPKSLANDFGTDIVYPMILEAGLSPADALRTYTEHICVQIRNSIEGFGSGGGRLLATGGGAHNRYLIARLQELLEPMQIEVVVPDKELVDNKEALVMALIGVLRWREERNVLASVTGASRDSIGGAVWIGQEA
jgi:anhydro-N-acetylmuramic acid kinase